jgi:hypothetical protein
MKLFLIIDDYNSLLNIKCFTVPRNLPNMKLLFLYLSVSKLIGKETEFFMTFNKSKYCHDTDNKEE